MALRRRFAVGFVGYRTDSAMTSCRSKEVRLRVAGKRPEDEVLSEIELELELETVQTTVANRLLVHR